MTPSPIRNNPLKKHTHFINDDLVGRLDRLDLPDLRDLLGQQDLEDRQHRQGPEHHQRLRVQQDLLLHQLQLDQPVRQLQQHRLVPVAPVGLVVLEVQVYRLVTELGLVRELVQEQERQLEDLVDLCPQF